MKISHKVVGVVAVSCLGVGLAGLYGIFSSSKNIKHIGGEVVPAVRSLLSVAYAQEAFANRQKDLLNPYRVREAKEAAIEEMAAELSAIDRELDVYRKSRPDSEEENKLWEEFTAALEEWKTDNKKLLEVYDELSAQGVREPEKLIGTLNGRLSEVRMWVVELASSIMTRKMFLGELDATATEIWDWRETFKSENERLQTLIRKDLAAPLTDLYATGQKVTNIFDEYGKTDEAASLAMSVYTSETLPAERSITKAFEAAIREANFARELYALMKAQYAGRCVNSMGRIQQLLDKLIEVNTNLASEATNEAVRSAWRQSLITASSALLAVILGVLITRGIIRPLSESVNLAQAVRSGDLSKRLRVESSDEAGRLTNALNEMADDLTARNKEVQEGMAVLASIADRLSGSATELAENTSKASSAVSETVTTVEQVRRAATTARGRAGNVLTEARDAVGIADAGRSATRETIARMKLIEEHMESIGETVIKLSDQSATIEEIMAAVQDLADQSNLLAVNASIEAARAGEAGKGFAVVASEIKNLADESRAAVERVRGILADTRAWIDAVVRAGEEGGQAVRAGVEQSTRAGESIERLAAGVEASAQAASVIDTSSEQQVVGVDQVAQAMINIENVVRANLDSASDLSDAAVRLQDLSRHLKSLVERYKTAEAEAGDNSSQAGPRSERA